MLKVTLRGVWGKKLRFLLTGIAVILGVAFMVGTLVFTDTTTKTFNDLFANVTKGTDAYIRGKKVFSSDFGDQRNRIPQATLQQVTATPGVRAAQGTVASYAQVVGKDGKVIGTQGAPNLAYNYPTVPQLNQFRIQVGGHEPRTDDEVVIDLATAKKAGLQPGDRVKILTQQAPREYTLSGAAKFGTADSPGGATIVLFTLPQIQRIAQAPGQLDAISVVGNGDISQSDLVTRLQRSLDDPNVEILTGAQITKENQDAIAESFSFFNTFLLVFAGIALFVGIFLIYNTFTIVVAQRMRELALLRAIGASRRQVTVSILSESLIIGVIASLIGLVAGVGLSVILKVGLAAGGLSIPSTGLVILPRTIIVALVVGTVITVVSGVMPALRAGRVPPVAAMRDLGVVVGRTRTLRVIAGTVLTGLGAVLLAVGLFASVTNAIAYVGGGAIVVFVGVFVLSPAFSKPLSQVLGTRAVGVAVCGVGVLLGAVAVALVVGGLGNASSLGSALIGFALGAVLLALGGVTLFRAGRAPFSITGQLARDNAMRNPRRTAATASALMIGVALVAFIAIFAQSIKASISSIVDDSFRSDFVVASKGFRSGFSPDLARQLAALPEVAVAAPLRFGPAQVDGKTVFLLSGNPAATAQAFDLQPGGDFAALSPTGLAVSDTVLTNKGWSLGQAVPIRFAQTGTQTFTVQATFKAESFGPRGNFYISNVAYNANFAPGVDQQVAIIKAPGVSVAAARRAIEPVVARYPSAELQDQTQFKQSREATIDRVVNLIYGLLALAVFIAVLGIANTLGLSIYERTHEIGLLRAVGMTRVQLRESVRWESVIIALFGTVLGFIIGVCFGWAVVEALSENGIRTLAIPWGTLAVIVVVALFAGIAAAVFPAWRAGRLNVLSAIASE